MDKLVEKDDEGRVYAHVHPPSLLIGIVISSILFWALSGCPILKVTITKEDLYGNSSTAR